MDKIKVADLRAELGKYGLDTKGNKSDMYERLLLFKRAHNIEHAGQAGSTDAAPREHIEPTDPPDGATHVIVEDVRPTDSASQISSARSRASQSSSVAMKKAEEAANRAELQIKLKKLEERQRMNRQLAELQDKKELHEAQEALEIAAARERAFADSVPHDPGVAIVGESISADKISQQPNNMTERQAHVEAKEAHASVDATRITAGLLRLPTIELGKFSGKVTDFHHFMKAFDLKIASKINDDAEKLYYLEQHVEKGTKAHNIVTGCMYLENGYEITREQLMKRYGQPSVVSAAYLDMLENFSPIRYDDAEALDRFSLLVSRAKNAMGNASNSLMGDPRILRSIATKLPTPLLQRWRHKADDIEERGRAVLFEDLAHFIVREARVASNPVFGSEMDKRTQTAKTKPKSMVMAVTTAQAPQEKRCLFCQRRNHDACECRDLQSQTAEQNKVFVRDGALCFGCLKRGHRSADCRRKATCGMCGRRHPTSLHITTRQSQSQGGQQNRQHWQQHGGYQQQRDEQQHQQQDEYVNQQQGQQGGSQPQQGRQVEQQVQHQGQRSEQHHPTRTGGAARATSCSAQHTMNCGIMNIVPVKIFSAEHPSRIVETLAFLDNGSSASFMTPPLLKRLGATSSQKSLVLTTVITKKVLNTQVVGGLMASDVEDNHTIKLPPVYTLESLPISKDEVPSRQDVEDWQHLRDVPLQMMCGDVELLIGTNCPEALEPWDIVPSQQGGPYAVRGVFGWTLCGPRKDSQANEHKTVTATVNRIKTECADLDDMLKNMYNEEFKENMSSEEKGLSQEDRQWLKKADTGIQKTHEGHYKLPLPFRDEKPQMPDSKPMAMKRLESLRKKIEKNPQFAADYSKYMENLIEEGHAEEVPRKALDAEDSKKWYLPHHGVYHPSKPSKLRVVFDCAAKSQGCSLNDVLLSGPDVTNSLIGVLLRFRQEPIALIGDVKAMFHQVKVPTEDRDYLRFLWWPRGNFGAKPSEYRMTVHLFGAVSSSSSANYALRKTADDNIEFSKDAEDVIRRNFYVDDCLVSVKSLEEAETLLKEVRGLSKTGGFHLTKFMTNCKSLLVEVPEEDRQATATSDIGDSEKVLGVQWLIGEDRLGFKVKQKKMPPTKRGVLSVISSVFDPLGLAAPFVLRGKQILQELTRMDVGWDEVIPEDQLQMWEKWTNEMTKLSELKVDRCIKPPDYKKVTTAQLHHFSDASLNGYGSVCFLRSIDETGRIHCAFLIAKSRVAPLKTMTVPRLELAAATVSVRINTLLQKELDIEITGTFYWTDSSTVLRYINNEKARYHTFVANRLAIIRDGSSPTQWRWVSSEANPSDDASRGLDAATLLERDAWRRGPNFLWKSENAWPEMPFIVPPEPNDPELKGSATCAVVVGEEGRGHEPEVGDDPSPTDKFIQAYSDWFRLKKAVAWILRGRKNLQRWRIQRQLLEDQSEGGDELKTSGEAQKMLDNRQTPQIGSKEMEEAEKAILAYVQRQAFPEELQNLTPSGEDGEGADGQTSLKKTNKLYKLNPFVEEGLLRVGGRLHQSPMPYEMRHPAVLPKDGHVTELLIRHHHHVSGHQGREHVLSSLRSKYWLMSGNTAVRSVPKRCVTCRRTQAPSQTQQMAELPQDRVIPGDPVFSYVGVDYFGPFLVRVGRSRAKRYGAIFTCLTTRAVHIEIAYSLNTSSFINALRRFTARRGPVKAIRSDNGTNFVGAERELRQEIEAIDDQAVHSAMLKKGIDWRFNAPGASHHGGAWERQIRSCRKILSSIAGQQSLDDESLHTFLCEVEGIINSRPLTCVSTDAGDLEPLTPNHLLLLRGGSADPLGSSFSDADVYRKRWRHVQYMADLFWRRWTTEYLHLLQKRQKWVTIRENLKEDDVVLMVDDGPRGHWSLGRVCTLLRDRKGLVRKVVVRSGHSNYTRPITKLVKLCGSV